MVSILYFLGKEMKNKILCLIVITLLITIVPSSSTATEKQSEEDLLFLKGIVVISEIENNTVHAFAYRLRYIELTETERSLGRVWFNKVIFPDGFIKIPLPGTFGTFILGIVKGQGGLAIGE